MEFRLKCDYCEEEKNAAELMTCSVCKAAFYCNVTCQKADWKKEHKRICNRVENEKREVTRFNAAFLNELKEKCVMLLKRAQLYPKQSENRLKCLEEAQMALDEVVTAIPSDLALRFLQVDIEKYRDNWARAVELLLVMIKDSQDGLTLFGKKVGQLDLWRMRERQVLGDCYVELGEYEKARDSYRMSMSEMEDQTPENINLIVRCFSGYSLCSYELGDYKSAIDLGNAALEMNRHFPGRYIPVAKAYKETGRFQDAIRTLKTAKFYGKEWDPEGYDEVISLLQEWEQQEPDMEENH